MVAFNITVSKSHSCCFQWFWLLTFDFSYILSLKKLVTKIYDLVAKFFPTVAKNEKLNFEPPGPGCSKPD